MKAVEIISVPVTDQQRAKEFYLKMGLTLVSEMPFGKDQTWIQLSFPDGGASITLVTWFDKLTAGCIQGFVIACDNIEADIQELNKKGIQTGKIEDMPWGKFASVKDPDGNTWSLHQK